MTKTYFLTLLVALLAITSGISQKYGYINSTELLIGMPQVKEADSQLEAYQKQLLSKGESMVKAFETEYTKYAQEAQGGQLTGLQMQQREADLGKKQQEIRLYEQEVQQKMITKREELYKPILDKVKAIVEQIGKDGGYTMIFDQAVSGAIVYGTESDNIMSQVKAKLGVQ